MRKYPTVQDIRVIKTLGPWDTKSNGKLYVQFAIPKQDMNSLFFSFNSDDMKELPNNILGLRCYKVSGIMKGSVGANEWHKIRNELVIASKGRFLWTCTDVLGNTSEFIVDNTQSILTPSYILHRYEALEDETEIEVFNNTIFDPNKKETQDTYTADSFFQILTTPT